MFQVKEKNQLKAKSYMEDLSNKDKQLQNARIKVMDQEEEMKKLSLLKEKLTRERTHILGEMRKMEHDIAEMRATNEGQQRLLKSSSGHAKNQAALLNEAQGAGSVKEACNADVARNERIARQMNKSAFMGLGENPPKLASES